MQQISPSVENGVLMMKTVKNILKINFHRPLKVP
jgi:hypothetical protein